MSFNSSVIRIAVLKFNADFIAFFVLLIDRFRKAFVCFVFIMEAKMVSLDSLCRIQILHERDLPFGIMVQTKMKLGPKSDEPHKNHAYKDPSCKAQPSAE